MLTLFFPFFPAAGMIPLDNAMSWLFSCLLNNAAHALLPAEKRAGDLTSSATVAGAGSGLGTSVFALQSERVVGRGGLSLPCVR